MSKKDPPNNSRQRAKAGQEYEKYPTPKTVEELTKTINMWGLYMQAWGKEVHKAIHALEGTAGQGATHLDPPPPPYDPEPT